jgi:hypothetical protein
VLPAYHRSSRVALGALIGVTSGAFVFGCRGAPTSEVDAGGAASSSASAAVVGSVIADEPLVPDAATGEARRDAGALRATCDGLLVPLLGAAVDPACAISEREWKERSRALSAADGGALATLRQEARRDGDAIVFSIVNAGRSALVVPLIYHPEHPELAFSVFAETTGKGIFELAGVRDLDADAERAPQKPKTTTAKERRPQGWDALAQLDAGLGANRVHTAQITIRPGGRATARLGIDPRVVKRLDKSCPPTESADGGAPCLPARLSPGPVVLHVGQFVVGNGLGGAPARVEWEAPLR